MGSGSICGMNLSRRSRAGLVCALALGALLGPRWALADGPAQTKVAVLDVKATGPVAKKQIQGLSQVVASVVAARPSLQVLTSEDIRTMLGFQAEKQLLGCTDSHCLAQIGGALGVGFVVAPEISRVGKTWLVTVVVLDVQNARAVARKTGTAQSEDDLVTVTTRETKAVLPALLPKQARPAKQTTAAGAKAPAGKPSPSPESSHTAPATAAPAAAIAPAPSPPGRGALAWTLTGVGAAAVIVGAILYGNAWSVNGRYAADPSNITWSEAQDAEAQSQIGVATAVLGVAAVAGSFLVPAPHPAGTTLGLSVLPGGAYAEVTISLGGGR